MWPEKDWTGHEEKLWSLLPLAGSGDETPWQTPSPHALHPCLSLLPQWAGMGHPLCQGKWDQVGSLLRRALSVFMHEMWESWSCVWPSAMVQLCCCFEDCFKLAYVLFWGSRSNSFGKAFIQLGAFVKLDSQQDRWIWSRRFLFFFQIAQKIWLSSVCHDHS